MVGTVRLIGVDGWRMDVDNCSVRGLIEYCMLVFMAQCKATGRGLIHL